MTTEAEAAYAKLLEHNTPEEIASWVASQAESEEPDETYGDLEDSDDTGDGGEGASGADAEDFDAFLDRLWEAPDEQTRENMLATAVTEGLADEEDVNNLKDALSRRPARATVDPSDASPGEPHETDEPVVAAAVARLQRGKPIDVGGRLAAVTNAEEIIDLYEHASKLEEPARGLLLAQARALIRQAGELAGNEQPFGHPTRTTRSYEPATITLANGDVIATGGRGGTVVREEDASGNVRESFIPDADMADKLPAEAFTTEQVARDWSTIQTLEDLRGMTPQDVHAFMAWCDQTGSTKFDELMMDSGDALDRQLESAHGVH